jgi:hypothetical protein
MRICWVTNEKYYSRLLRFLFNNLTSHVGVIFNFDGISLATDLNKPMGKVWDSRYWFHKYNAVWTMDVKLSEHEEIALYKTCSDYCVLRVYDMPAYYFGMIAGLKWKFFNIPLPKVNAWSANTGSTCQEVLTPLVQTDILRKIEPRLASLDPTKFSACTPDMTIGIMKKATEGNPLIKWTFYG